MARCMKRAGKEDARFALKYFMAIVCGALAIWYFFAFPAFGSKRIKEPPTKILKNDPKRSVYLGQGCFWHTQYDFYKLESHAASPFKGRAHANITALVGYAGGLFQQNGLEGRVCYHGERSMDYSRLGHGEAVSVELDWPDETVIDGTTRAQFKELVVHYFEDGFRDVGEGKRERLDPQDVGAEYRNMIGIPGGMESPLYKEVKAANKYNMPLKSGTGGPPGSDTEGEYVVYIYDSNKFPFFRAETYHQFHPNTVVGRDLPRDYLTNLVETQRAEERLISTGCPEDSFSGAFAMLYLAVVVGGAGSVCYGCLSMHQRFFDAAGKKRGMCRRGRPLQKVHLVAEPQTGDQPGMEERDGNDFTLPGTRK